MSQESEQIAEIGAHIAERYDISLAAIGGWTDGGIHIDESGAVRTRRIVLIVVGTEGMASDTTRRHLSADLIGLHSVLMLATDAYTKELAKQRSGDGAEQDVEDES